MSDCTGKNVTSAMDETHVAAKSSRKVASRQLSSSTGNENKKTKWKQDEFIIAGGYRQDRFTIAGGNGQGNQLNQFSHPQGIYIDNDDKSIYIADFSNHRIVQWECGAKDGKVVAGGNGYGNLINQLTNPRGVIVDKMNDSIIICDGGNRRVIRYSRRNDTNGQIIISDISCTGLAMNNNEDLYVSDWEKNEVRRWKKGNMNETIVAGGNGKGNHLNQLNSPTFIFVDQDHSVYLSDLYNHRVMKWMKGAKEGIVVAGGQGEGNSLTQLSHPQGVTVDSFGNVYVADTLNHQIMCWLKGSREGRIVVGSNGPERQPGPLYFPTGLSFDQRGNLYVVDSYNSRVQKFNGN